MICFYHFPCLSLEREIRKVGKDLRKENIKFKKQMTEKLMMKLEIDRNDRGNARKK